MITAENKKLIEDYLAFYNAFDIEGMKSLLHDDVQFKNMSGGKSTLLANGIGAFDAAAKQSAKFLTEREQTITSFEEDGDAINAYIDFRAVLAMDLPSGQKTGDTLNLKGISAFTIVDGKITTLTDKT